MRHKESSEVQLSGQLGSLVILGLTPQLLVILFLLEALSVESDGRKPAFTAQIFTLPFPMYSLFFPNSCISEQNWNWYRQGQSVRPKLI